MDPAEGSTPTAHWGASPSWWVGDDARSDDGVRNEHHPLAEPVRSSDMHRSSRLAAAGSEEGASHRPRDSRRLFGDLPNSSLDPDLLGDPIQRELERRAAEADIIDPQGMGASMTSGPRIVTFADSARQPDTELGGNGANSQGFWQLECSRLEGQIASLAREKERWESERRHLLAEDVERARELAGLRHAVEAQSQIVMESLVAAQRLAASGGAPVPPRDRTAAVAGDVLQTAWVQPRSPERMADVGRKTGGGRTYIERSPWEFPQAPKGWIFPTKNRSGYGVAGTDAGMSFDWRQIGGSGAAAEVSLSQRRSPATGVIATEKAAPSPSYDLSISRNTTSSNNSKTSRPAASASSESMEMVPAPRSSSAAFHFLPQADSGGVQRPTASNHPRTSGWRRVVSGRGPIGSDNGDGTEGLDREVWEWNGRRVMLHVQPQEGPSAAENCPDGEEKAEGGQGEEARADVRTEEELGTLATAATPTIRADEAAAVAPAAAAVVPQSLLKDIEDIKAMVKALATAAVGDRASPATATARPFQQPLQPRPPENAPAQITGTSSPQTSSPIRRRVSLPAGGAAQQPIASLQPGSSGAPISEGPEGGVGDQPRTVASDLQAGNGLFGGDVERESESGHAPKEDSPSGAGEGMQRGAERAGLATGRGTSSLPRDGEGGEEKGRRARPWKSSGDGREGGSIDAKGGNGHGPALAMEPPDGEPRERSDELAELSQPPPEYREDANRSNAELEPPAASLAEDDKNVGVEGTGGGDGQDWFLDEAPEKCFVG